MRQTDFPERCAATSMWGRFGNITHDGSPPMFLPMAKVRRDLAFLIPAYRDGPQRTLMRSLLGLR